MKSFCTQQQDVSLNSGLVWDHVCIIVYIKHIINGSTVTQLLELFDDLSLPCHQEPSQALTITFSPAKTGALLPAHKWRLLHHTEPRLGFLAYTRSCTPTRRPTWHVTATKVRHSCTPLTRDPRSKGELSKSAATARRPTLIFWSDRKFLSQLKRTKSQQRRRQRKKALAVLSQNEQVWTKPFCSTLMYLRWCSHTHRLLQLCSQISKTLPGIGYLYTWGGSDLGEWAKGGCRGTQVPVQLLPVSSPEVGISLGEMGWGCACVCVSTSLFNLLNTQSPLRTVALCSIWKKEA